MPPTPMQAPDNVSSFGCDKGEFKVNKKTGLAQVPDDYVGRALELGFTLPPDPDADPSDPPPGQ